MYHIEAQDAHPDSVHSVFRGFTGYLTSRGYDPTTVARSIKQIIGHHRLAHMALRGPPNFLERRVYEVG